MQQKQFRQLQTLLQPPSNPPSIYYDVIEDTDANSILSRLYDRRSLIRVLGRIANALERIARNGERQQVSQKEELY